MAASDAASQRAARGLLQIQQLPQAQVVPTRRMRGAPAAVAGGKGDRGGAAAASAAVADDRSTVPADLTDLLPRTDISGQVTEELIRRLGSANWKACRCPIQSCHMSIMYCSERAAHGQQATRFCGGAGQRQLEGAQPIMLLKSRFFRRDGSRLCVRGMLGECPVRGRVFVLPSQVGAISSCLCDFAIRRLSCPNSTGQAQLWANLCSHADAVCNQWVCAGACRGAGGGGRAAGGGQRPHHAQRRRPHGRPQGTVPAPAPCQLGPDTFQMPFTATKCRSVFLTMCHASADTNTARQTELALCPEARCRKSICHGATHTSICVALSDLATPTATWACARCCVKQRNGRDIDSYLLCLVCRRGGWRTPTATWACARCYCWASWARPWGRPSSAPPGRALAPPSSASPTRRSPCAALGALTNL